MYDQLKVLEKMILDIKKQHQLVSGELNRLKQRPNIDPKELSALKAKLDSSYAERDNGKKRLVELDNRYQSLAEAHHMIGEEQDKIQNQLAELQQSNEQLQQHNNTLKQQSLELQQQNEEIKKQNNDLQEKNQLAAERTQVVLQRLTRIDQIDG
ncbi:hypothetical protein KPY62_10870 [Psychrobacter sp. TAE2020]|uniref:hypothetical protein n=1 Tax=Psychrobacter sp. TAE2020 TaxID=2846762 RepID=UPI001C0F6B4A|nr:hypothetical protein [Psychrobacter sp. TAE2020]MBU5617582.1 hypothetical protein [Psychrobacter sp. TAE2020]